MATVYLARDLRHDRPVAVKVLRPELGATLGSERFLREIQIAARLNHPHILALLDSGEAGGYLYYVMPLVEGESLRDRLDRERHLPLEDAVRLAAEIADGLSEAHSLGIVHRDIKPENILLSGNHAVIADFGIARAISEVGGSKLTETGMAVGTPSYMAPEQASGIDPVDGRTDLYALGCVLYEMLAGEPPFTGPSAMAVLARHSMEQVPSVRIVRGTVPEWLEAIIDKALAKVPADRFSTAMQFADALRAPVEGSFTSGRRLVPRPRRWQSRGRGFALGGAVLAAAVVAWSGYLFWPERVPEPLDANLIAVAPFAVSDTSLVSWSRGVEARLSRALDGFGPLRTLAPTALGTWSTGDVDFGTAPTLGRDMGAGLVVVGTFDPMGTDSVDGTLTVVDVRTEASLGDVRVRGGLTHMGEFADTLTAAVARVVGSAQRLGASRYTGLGSTRVTALKAFLRGEQAFRRTAYDSALTAYGAAIAQDSQFALAYYRVGLTHALFDRDAGWRQLSTAGLDSLYLYFQRAGRSNRGLPLHDSLVVEMGACLAEIGLDREATDSTQASRANRCEGLALRSATLFPDDAEAWFSLGIVRRLLRSWIDISPDRGTISDAYNTALAQDSGYGPVYHALIEIGLRSGAFDAVQRLAATYLTLDPPDAARAQPRVLAHLLAPDFDTVVADQILDSMPSELLLGTGYSLLWLTDPHEATVRIGRSLFRRRADARYWLASGENVRQFLSAHLIYRGHLEEAYRVSGTQPSGWFPSVFPELAVSGAVPETVADSVFREWLTSGEFHPGLSYARRWWAQRGDTASIDEYLEREPSDTSSWRAYRALARRDTSEALVRFGVARAEGEEHFFDPLTLTELLVAQGRDSAAYDQWRFAGVGVGWPTITRVRSLLELARIAEKIGELEDAGEAYQLVLDAWANPDESLQGYVMEARQDLARLALASIEP
jgi:serine/threonine-protein kinase